MTRQEFTLKGWHVAIGFVTAFGIIIAVNLTLAYKAVKTFPGLEVRNSYIASQSFDDRRAAQIGLGWTAAAWIDGGELVLRFTDRDGAPLAPASLNSTLGRNTVASEDHEPAFLFDGKLFRAPVDLGQGAWSLRIEARAEDGTLFAQRLPLWVSVKP